ncbi:MAG TPA: heme-binding protein [Terriglobales bacterium]|nr:heme-binding protein [Terriglobales bacterium]
MSALKQIRALVFVSFFWISSYSVGQAAPNCTGLPEYSKLKSALVSAVREGENANGGLGNQMWAVVVNRDGIVCVVTFSGPDRGAQWPGSRMIAAEKASTANALSGPNFALSTANLYAGSQPGGSLFGLTTSTPPNPQAAYAGKPEDFGQPSDPLVGKPVGGVIVFAGGLALYDSKGKIVGALGLSGDTSCTDHVIAWKVRHAIGLDGVPMGVGTDQTDNIIFDIQNGVSASGFGHPVCQGGRPSEDIARKLPQNYPVKRK